MSSSSAFIKTNFHPCGNLIMTNRKSTLELRRGAVAVYVAVSLSAVMGMAALAVDVGMLYAAQAEMQRTADASALAAAWELLDDERLKGAGYLAAAEDVARDAAVAVAVQNVITHDSPVIDTSDDLEFGYVSDLSNGGAMVFGGVEPANAVVVHVRRDSERGGSIALTFARFLGMDSQALAADATAAFADGIVGYEVTQNSGNAQLLPFTLHIDSWEGLLSGTVTTGDNYGYDSETGEVTAGGDGIPELNLYPGAGADQLPPGNFGTVDIGSSNNSTADIARQILYGVNGDDLAYFGGRLEFGPDGTLVLNGDTGLSAGVKDELEAIKGHPRAIPIFTEVSGNGNNSMYTIVAFAGIRIMDVRLTGKMSLKHVIIQPACVVDSTALADDGPGPSYYVYRPVQLVR